MQLGSFPTRRCELKLGRYKLIDVVGSGSFGTVYKARDPELDRDVAIKIPRAGHVTREGNRERFFREAKLPIMGFADRLVFSPNGDWLVTGGEDMNKTVRIWDTSNGGSLHALAGHTGYVIAVAFSPDGKLFASAGEDTTIRLWDATQDPPRELHKLRGHLGLISRLAFSPDSRRLVSGSRDRTIKIWDLSAILRGVSTGNGHGE